jgi:hypothetical protein
MREIKREIKVKNQIQTSSFIAFPGVRVVCMEDQIITNLYPDRVT